MIDDSPNGDRRTVRAVSPVIGVILMVAITVILAAVIGAFVLEIGDQQETAPNTSFSSEQGELLIASNNAARNQNLTEVQLSHGGGDVLDVSQTEIKIAGNATVWGLDEIDGSAGLGGGSGRDTVVPQPNFFPSLGSNEQVTFTSGETWSAIWRGGDPGSSGSAANPLRQDQYVEPAGVYHYAFPCMNDATCYGISPADDGPTWIQAFNGGGSYGPQVGHGIVPKQGDEVQVVWTAESGGKTQTLFKYSVQ